MPTGPLIIVSGPAGSGKSTLIDRLLKSTRWPVHLSVSVTTRPPRQGEEEGVAYYFWAREAFEKEIAADSFLEWANVFGNYYGTLRREVEPYRQQGQGALLEIDVQGWEQVKRKCPEAVSIFIRTSSLETYEKRLRERKSETAATLARRLEGASRELALAPRYDHQVINDDLDEALARLRGIVDSLFVPKTALTEG